MAIGFANRPGVLVVIYWSFGAEKGCAIHAAAFFIVQYLVKKREPA